MKPQTAFIRHVHETPIRTTKTTIRLQFKPGILGRLRRAALFMFMERFDLRSARCEFMIETTFHEVPDLGSPLPQEQTEEP